ncbi:hypothetical protein HDU88_008940 [Geranomyces variabilis]|nr:hypothetical protein HDU88_008940 [Geranomyces variabilis]
MGAVSIDSALTEDAHKTLEDFRAEVTRSRDNLRKKSYKRATMRNNKTAELLRLDTLLEQQEEYLKEQRLRTGFQLQSSLLLGVTKAATAQNTLFDAAFVRTKRQRDEQDQPRRQRAKVAKPFASPNPSARSSPFQSFD